MTLNTIFSNFSPNLIAKMQKDGLAQAIDQAQLLALAFEQDTLKKALKKMVPEFKSNAELEIIKEQS